MCEATSPLNSQISDGLNTVHDQHFRPEYSRRLSKVIIEREIRGQLYLDSTVVQGRLFLPNWWRKLEVRLYLSERGSTFDN
jgi:hypothetical protein